VETPREVDGRIAWVTGLAFFLMSASLFAGYRFKQERSIMHVEQSVAGWPAAPRLLARVMMEKYGLPDESNQSRMVWLARAPWKRIVVHQDEHNFPLEQVVDYNVRPQGPEALRAFGHGVIADSDHAELSAQNERESTNFLALNLADEVASGACTLEQAERVYAKTVSLAQAGKSSAYTEGLLFDGRVEIPSVWAKDLRY
jgi:hypothetical protein